METGELRKLAERYASAVLINLPEDRASRKRVIMAAIEAAVGEAVGKIPAPRPGHTCADQPTQPCAVPGCAAEIASVLAREVTVRAREIRERVARERVLRTEEAEP